MRVKLILILLAISHGLSAQAGGPQVLVETFPETPAAGIPWTLTLLVDYGAPEDVTAAEPPFAPYLILDRIVKNPRITGAKTQTAIEYRFIPNVPGRFILQPFTVTSPSGVTKTSPLALNIRSAGTEQPPLNLRFVWEGAPAQLTAGENAAFSLLANGLNLTQFPQELFMPEVPPGVILTPLPITAAERAGG